MICYLHCENEQKIESKINGAPRDSLTSPICDWSQIGKSIRTTFTDYGYLDVAMGVHLLLTWHKLAAVATLN